MVFFTYWVTDLRYHRMYIWLMYSSVRGRCGRDRMIIGFTTTYAISAYHEVYNIMWSSLSVTCDRLMVFSASSDFLHQENWPPRYSWNIVESDVKQHKRNNIFECLSKLLKKSHWQTHCQHFWQPIFLIW